ncbi:hypothetical protein CFP56_009026 [Quercus suber]|uniref:Uncharacterized protein n=1 Tax=Quercus suber TaxID=58331 RepID=A0AAW0L221_QUESU
MEPFVKHYYLNSQLKLYALSSKLSSFIITIDHRELPMIESLCHPESFLLLWKLHHIRISFHLFLFN